jgi:hypothetical protein
MDYDLHMISCVEVSKGLICGGRLGSMSDKELYGRHAKIRESHAILRRALLFYASLRVPAAGHYHLGIATKAEV